MSQCALCHGTGSLSKTVSGNLDCAYCEAAYERIALEQWYTTIAKSNRFSVLDLMWLVVLREREIQQGEKDE